MSSIEITLRNKKTYPGRKPLQTISTSKEVKHTQSMELKKTKTQFKVHHSKLIRRTRIKSSGCL